MTRRRPAQAARGSGPADLGTAGSPRRRCASQACAASIALSPPLIATYISAPSAIRLLRGSAASCVPEVREQVHAKGIKRRVQTQRLCIRQRHVHTASRSPGPVRSRPVMRKSRHFDDQRGGAVLDSPACPMRISGQRTKIVPRADGKDGLGRCGGDRRSGVKCEPVARLGRLSGQQHRRRAVGEGQQQQGRRNREARHFGSGDGLDRSRAGHRLHRGAKGP